MKQQQLHQELKLLQSLTTTEILNGRDDNNSPYLKLLFQVYQALFKEVCTSCPTKISGYITRIKKFKFEQMAQSKFILKDQSVIIIPGTSLAYSNANLTDEVAIKFIKENPNRKVLFSKLPEDLEKLLSDEVVEKSFIDRTQAEILPLIPELDLEDAKNYLVKENAKSKARAKVIEALENRISELTSPEDLEEVEQVENSENENELDVDSVTEVSDEVVED